MKELHIIAHNLRSRENIGALFRIADGLGIYKLWLTGYSPKPPHIRIEKASLGAEKSVDFEYIENVNEVIQILKKSGIPVYALEHTKEAIPLAHFKSPQRMAFILGTETTGVPTSLIQQTVGSIEIPMHGAKSSLNVAVAAGIAAWHILSA